MTANEWGHSTANEWGTARWWERIGERKGVTARLDWVFQLRWVRKDEWGHSTANEWGTARWWERIGERGAGNEWGHSTLAANDWGHSTLGLGISTAMGDDASILACCVLVGSVS